MAGAMVAGWRDDLAGFVGLVSPGSKQPARLGLGVASALQPEGLKQASPRMGEGSVCRKHYLVWSFYFMPPWKLAFELCKLLLFEPLDGQHFVIFYQAHRVRRDTLSSLWKAPCFQWPVGLFWVWLESLALALIVVPRKPVDTRKNGSPQESPRTVPSL